jgi:hypothetical protein
MSLRLNGWPPVASHFVALLTGVSLANISHQDRAKSQSYSDYHSNAVIQWVMEQKRITLGKDVSLEEKGRFYLVDLSNRCLIVPTPLLVASFGRRLSLELERRDQISSSLLYELAYSKKAIQLEVKRPQWNLCKDRSMVVYEE